MSIEHFEADYRERLDETYLLEARKAVEKLENAPGGEIVVKCWDEAYANFLEGRKEWGLNPDGTPLILIPPHLR